MKCRSCSNETRAYGAPTTRDGYQTTAMRCPHCGTRQSMVERIDAGMPEEASAIVKLLRRDIEAADMSDEELDAEVAAKAEPIHYCTVPGYSSPTKMRFADPAPAVRRFIIGDEVYDVLQLSTDTPAQVMAQLEALIEAREGAKPERMKELEA